MPSETQIGIHPPGRESHPELPLPISLIGFLLQCASELSRELFRRFNRRFTSSNHSHTSRPHDDSVCHRADLSGLLRCTDAKPHTYWRRGMGSYRGNQLTESFRNGFALTCHTRY